MSNKLGKVIGGVVVLGLAYAGTSWWLGSKVEQHYQAELEQTLLRLGASKVLDRSYQRGVFDAQATAVVEVMVPAELLPVDVRAEAEAEAEDVPAALLPVRVHLVQRIKHGPVVEGGLAAAVVETRVAQVEGVSDQVRPVFAKVQTPTVRTVHDFSGGLSGRFVLPAGEIAHPGQEDGDLLSWQTLTYDFSRSGDRSTGQASLHWPGAVWRLYSVMASGQPGLELQVKDLRTDYEVRGALPDQWLLMPGKYSVDVGLLQTRLRIPGEGKQFLTILSMSDWRSEGQLSLQNTSLRMQEQGAGKAVVLEVPMERLAYTGLTEGLDRGVIEPLQNLVQKINQAADPMAAIPTDEALRPLYQSLLAAPATSSLKVEGMAAGSQARLDLKIGLQPPAEKPADVPLQFQVLQALRADLGLRVPKQWDALIAEATANLVGPEQAAETCLLPCWAEEGVLKDEGDAWILKLDFGAETGLRLNGQPLMGAAP